MNDHAICPMCGAANGGAAKKCGSCGEEFVTSDPAKIRHPYTPARAYRVSVVPFAVLLWFHGAVMLTVAAFRFMPITDLPFIHDAFAQRVLITVVAVIHIIFGIGFILRLRSFWTAFFVYGAVATCFAAIASYFDPPKGFDATDATISALSALLINGALLVGLYFATRPAFEGRVGSPEA